jgi:hypothetical protein
MTTFQENFPELKDKIYGYFLPNSTMIWTNHVNNFCLSKQRVIEELENFKDLMIVSTDLQPHHKENLDYCMDMFKINLGLEKS